MTGNFREVLNFKGVFSLSNSTGSSITSSGLSVFIGRLFETRKSLPYQACDLHVKEAVEDTTTT
jgi:hypothetical protein